MRKECRNVIRAEIVWENRKWNKISLSQYRIVSLLQNFHDFSMSNNFLKVTFSEKRFWFLSVHSEMCNCSASTLLQQLPEKTYCSAKLQDLQCTASLLSLWIHVWNKLPHGPAWMHVPLASHLWVYSSAVPKNPCCGFGHCYNEDIDKPLGSLLNVPYVTHFSFQSTLKMWIAGWPPCPLACFVVYNESCSLSSPAWSWGPSLDFCASEPPDPTPGCPWPFFFQLWTSTDVSSSNLSGQQYSLATPAPPSQPSWPIQRLANKGICPGCLHGAVLFWQHCWELEDSIR